MTTFSYSSVTEYMECGKRWELHRVSKVPETPAWWLILGSTVHEATEIADTSDSGDVDHMDIMEILDNQVELAKERAPIESWSRTYYDRGKNPEQMYYATFDKGCQYTDKWIQWRNDSDYDIVGVEVPISLPFHYEADQMQYEKGDIIFRGYVDRLVLERSTGKMGVVDLKTGKSTPSSDMQLGWYKVGVSEDKEENWLTPSWGAYWKADTGQLTEKVDLSKWTADLVHSYGQMFVEATDHEIFLPNLNAKCDRCPVQRACYAHSGSTEWSRKYDRLDPGYVYS